jgi:hypothetical protein
MQSLLISNYLNRQTYRYPETKEKLEQCKQPDTAFIRMIGENTGPSY